MKKTLYEIVGVARDATPEVLQAAAQSRMEAIRRAHEAGDANAATDSFALKEAFAVLRDPVKRAAYDDKLAQSAGMAATGSFPRLGEATGSFRLPPGADAEPIVYGPGNDEAHEDHLIMKGAVLAVVSVVIAAFIGKLAFEAEDKRLGASLQDEVQNFNVQAWVRSLGPAKAGNALVVPAKIDPTAPKAFSLEDFEREKEARDAALRRTMERERRAYDAEQRRAEYETQRQNARDIGGVR